jgi:cytosol alanyl aminopeptidase
MTLRHSCLPLLLLLAACATSPAPEAAKATAPAVPATAGVTVAPQGAAAEPPAGMRLPATVKPQAQRVELIIVPSAPGFEGTTELDVDLAVATDVVWLNVRALEVKTASARVGGTDAVAQISTAPERVALRFAHPLPQGRATLRLSFSGVISSTEDSGIFHQQEDGAWYAMTQFEETEARRAFPCVDEPSAKIPWDVTLKVPEAMVAVGNTPIASTEAAGEGMKRVHFARTKPLPSYLVAFAVGPYDFVEARPAGVNKTPMRVYVPKGRAAEAAYAARTSPEILEALEAYFGLPYPYEKLDVLAIPLTVHFGAMENAGLVTVASGRLLARKENESITFQRTWGVYAAHEFAHQWFGDSVTLAWWNDIWLNESFASWMENKILETWSPGWGMQVVEVTDRSDAATVDTLVTARSIRQPIESYDDINNAFDFITYQKGAAIIRMFETYLGKEKFQAGVHQYLLAHANGSATASDFLASISAATGTDVAPAFDTFLDQSGVPQLTVQLSCGRGKKPALLLSQERLLPVGTSATGDRHWQVPVCARWSSAKKDHRACVLMASPTATLPLDGSGCPDWVLPNADYAGYYRLNLKGNLLQTLVSKGRASLSAAETVGLLGDVNALVTAGRYPQAEGMKLSTRFAGAPARRVVEEAIALATVPRTFLPGTLEQKYPAWVRQYFGARARALGMQARPGEPEETRLLRQYLVAFAAGRGEDTQLIAAARGATERWLQDPTSVDTDMVNTALGIAGEFGDAKLHATLVDRLVKSPDRATRSRLLTALGAFRDPTLVKANIALVEAAPIDARELARLLYAASAYPDGHELVFQAVSSNFEKFAAQRPGRSVADLFFLGIGFCDAAHRASVEAAFAPHAEKALGGKRELAQTLESIDLCIATRAVQLTSVTGYLTPGSPRSKGGSGQP